MKQISRSSSANRGAGRPTSYTADICRWVMGLIAEGRSMDGCAAILGVHPEFSDAAKAGRAAATAFWESMLLDIAQGGSGNAQAVQWALRNRSRGASGWDHAHAKVQLSGSNGGAVQVQADMALNDARLLTVEQRAVLKRALRAVKEQGKAVT